MVAVSPKLKAKKILKWTGKIVLALSIPVACGAAVLAIAYPGSCRGMANQFLHASFHETTNLAFCINYWTKYMGLLAYDEQAHIYGFAKTPEAGMDEFERGKLAFHRGEFGRASVLIRDDIDRVGETESKLFWLAMSLMRQAEAENCLAALVTAPPVGMGLILSTDMSATAVGVHCLS
jgi:hypothetical protein